MTPSSLPIPAAQYLRVSTDRQEYSLENQTDEISKYAARHGFSVIQTYSDPAISGVLLRKRKGLKKLIQDVVQGQAPFRAVLVYDVSRWGRFQDTDESAHYEFLCKSAGVRVHYCAENFSNDDNLPNLIMKSLKRAMAGEYSRELGTKVFAGQRRGASQGFRQGSVPGFALRRMLVSSNGIAKQILADGERKSIASDRTILVPGPESEVRCVQEIYEMFLKRRMTCSDIARALNRQRVPYLKDAEWSLRAVHTILTHPKYMGCNVYGRFSQRLYTPLVQKPESEWIVTPGAFEPIVSPEIFAKVQQRIERNNSALPRNRSDADLLNALRAVRTKNGRIRVGLLKSIPHTPSAQTYHSRFGGVVKAYERIGYAGYWDANWIETRRRIQRLRNELMKEIVDDDPGHVCIECRRNGYRSRLQVSGTLVSVVASRPFHAYKDDVRWLLWPRPGEASLITLVARLNLECDRFKDMFLIPPVGEAVAVYLKDCDPRLHDDARLVDLSAFRCTIDRLLQCSSRFPRHLRRGAIAAS
jgi:DNA invertase Pin-like site-specific DNA recombinase